MTLRIPKSTMAWLFWTMLAIATLLGGCHEAELNSDPDQSVPAMVAMAQSYHEQADIAVQGNDLVAAEDAMRGLITSLAESPLEHDERLELGLDAYARLARILMDQGRLDDALAATDQGLAFGDDIGDTSLFAGYLHQIRGDILREKGDDRGAVDAHKNAITVFKGILEREAHD